MIQLSELTAERLQERLDREIALITSSSEADKYYKSVEKLRDAKGSRKLKLTEPEIKICERIDNPPNADDIGGKSQFMRGKNRKISWFIWATILFTAFARLMIFILFFDWVRFISIG